MKKCTKCEKVKTEEEFYKDKSTRDGLARWCKECQKAQHAAWHAENRKDGPACYGGMA